ncbi:hypothetical protein D9M69_283520 [compost metagenome]
MGATRTAPRPLNFIHLPCRSVDFLVFCIQRGVQGTLRCAGATGDTRPPIPCPAEKRKRVACSAPSN